MGSLVSTKWRRLSWATIGYEKSYPRKGVGAVFGDYSGPEAYWSVAIYLDGGRESRRVGRRLLEGHSGSIEAAMDEVDSIFDMMDEYD